MTNPAHDTRADAERPFAESGAVDDDGGSREAPPPSPAAAEVEEDSLQAQLAAAEARADERLNDLRRLAADFDNYRKRVARDQERVLLRANERLVKELVPVVDDLERAVEAAERPERAVPESGPGEGVRGHRVEVPPRDYEALLDGVRLVHRSLVDLFRREGLTEIATDGRFDPHVHEALLSQPSDAEEGTVIQVLQKGYMLGDTVLRPARVVVAAPKEDEGGAVRE